MNNKALRYFIVGTFVTLYIIVSLISTIHVIEFFKLSNPEWLAISLAVAFEIGAAASLASLIALKKMNRGLVWFLFILLTCMQMMGNTYYAFTHLENFQGWVDLFGLTDEELLYQKRILSIISGAVLPLVALGFIKSLVDYIKPDENNTALQKDADKVEELRKIEKPTALPNSQYGLAVTEEDVKQRAIKKALKKTLRTDITNDQDEVVNQTDLQEFLEQSGELTKKDIETYTEKSRIPERGKSFMNPQTMPGVNT
jgi:hypothetical protein